jgi:DNA-binding NarL/FixJ family response regulator
MAVVALVTDLFFISKIKSTADVLKVPLTIVRTADALLAQAIAGANPVIIDLNAAGVDIADVIRRCKSAENPPRIIAYLSHIQHDLAEAAQQAGADCVMPRSQFSAELPVLLQQSTINPS